MSFTVRYFTHFRVRLVPVTGVMMVFHLMLGLYNTPTDIIASVAGYCIGILILTHTEYYRDENYHSSQ